MKNFILLMIALLGFASYGQTAMKGSSGATSDTVTNAGTEYLTINTTATGISTYSIEYTATRISGTAAGTVTLEWSDKGVNYYAIDTSATLKKGTDSYTITNTATQGFKWTITCPSANYYRLKIVGSGTQVLKVEAVITGKSFCKP